MRVKRCADIAVKKITNRMPYAATRAIAKAEKFENTK
jgi:hypothetical protein